MDRAEARRRFSAAPVARLGTVGEGRPHVVPIVFACTGDRVVSAVDHKPKRSRALQRLENIRNEPRVAVLVDHYTDAWEELWWVRADGLARVVESGPEHAAAIEALVEKYVPYRGLPPAGPVIVIEVQRWSGWSARVGERGPSR